MPVSADSQFYTSYSPVQDLSSNASTSYTRSATSTTFKPESERCRDVYRAHHERAHSSYETEHVRSPKRSPSLLRRINAAMKSKSSSSTSSTRLDSPTQGSARAPRVDPMYAAPSAAGTSRLPSLPMNPVSRFRRARNAEKGVYGREREREKEKERGFPPDEWRVDGRTGQSGSASSRTRSEVRGYRSADGRPEMDWKPRESSRHVRAGSEGNWEEGRTRRAPAVHTQMSEPSPRSNVAGRSAVQNPVSHSVGELDQDRERRYLPTEQRIHERSGRRTYARATESQVPTGSPPRMGRYGVYASPPTAMAQIPNATPRQQRTSNGNAEPTERRRYASPTGRVEGWEVKIAPPIITTNNTGSSKSGSDVRARASVKTHTLGTNSPSLTLVADHPLMDRPLPSPPDSSEAAKAEEFAINLTKRMSILLNTDSVDFGSNSGSTPMLPSDPASTSTSADVAAHTPSANTSGTATPTGPTAVDDSARATGGEPGAVSTSSADSSSPFGTFLTNAREMNEAFVRGTESMWDKLFSKDKGKGKEPASVEADVVTGPQPEDGRKDSKSDSEETEIEIEGSHDIMLYSPLIPDADSLVEVAASEVVTLYGDGADEMRERAYRAELRRRWADGRGFVSFDALSMIEPVEEETSESDSDRVQAEREQVIAVPDAPKPTDGEHTVLEDVKSIPKEKVIWMPSPTQISVQVLWWGYRIYLPPPILHVLNSRSVETAKRAALLTSALTWLLENLPFTALPAALAPAALLLKALVPLLGMIGTFVAWSWKATVTFDRGNGVVLSATWLLPIVLVPGTWEESEVPRPPPGVGVESMVASPSKNQDT